MKKLCHTIAEWCCENTDVNGFSMEVTEYGLELMLNTSIKIMVLLLAGAITGRLPETAAVLAVFGCTRYFAGGYHCRTDLGCLGFMAGMCVLSVTAAEMPLNEIFLIPALLFCVYEMIYHAPRNSVANPVSDRVILLRKRYGGLVCMGVLLLLISVMPDRGMKWLVAAPLFIEALTLSNIFQEEEES